MKKNQFLVLSLAAGAGAVLYVNGKLIERRKMFSAKMARTALI